MGWIATLSTGEVVKEPEIYPRDEVTPWHLLIARCRADNLRIVELRLMRGGTLVTAMSNAQGYSVLWSANVPQRFKAIATHWQGIAAVFNGYVFINWVDERGRVYQEMQKLEDAYQHTTERD
jgi:hypothetical protein